MATKTSKIREARSKVDPRLAFLLEQPEKLRRKLKDEEDERAGKVAREIETAVAALSDERERPAAAKRLRELDREVFAPLTTGLFFPDSGQRKHWPIRMREPFASVFILSDASAADLKKLGAQVRSQAGDVFTAFVPLSAIPRLEESAAVRFIELARPLFPTLDEAVPYAQIDTFHDALPTPINGAGVIVGIVDTILDIYHPDFRTAANATRVRFLWDQSLTPVAGEAGPPIDPVLPGFVPAGGVTYGVEYSQANIDAELTGGAPAYDVVRHGNGATNAHGSHVAGIAVGNGLGQAGTFTGAAPAADIIFVSNLGSGVTAAADTTSNADAFSYIFARAAQLGQPCVVNLSGGDNQGPHDGTLLGEQFLDNLLLVPGRAITVSAGNSNNTACHAAGNVPAGGTADLVLNYSGAPTASDIVEIWYDGHDRFDVTVTVPTAPATVIGPVTPGNTANAVLASGVNVQVTSTLNDPRNGDNLITIIYSVPGGQQIPLGNHNIALTGTTVINGAFQAWVDRNNRLESAFLAPFLQEDTLTIGSPATAKRVITVGNHDKTAPTPAISASSGRGPTRDRRIKPEVAAVGTDVTSVRSRNMNAANPGALYRAEGGTSMSAPLVAGACACLFQCRGAATTWANLKQILEDTAGTTGLAIPSNAFGFGFVQLANGCTAAATGVDIWLRDNAGDTGIEPSTGIAWLSPDIEVLDADGNPVPNPTFDSVKRFNNIIRVTVRNRGTLRARNTEVHFYWADPSTNIPYPAAWNTTGIYNDTPAFVNQSNMIVIPQLDPGASTSVDFAWAPPPPGSNIAGDDHFCLLVRLENESDPSNIGAGGWTTVSARNNIGLHNVHVQPDDPGDSDMSFYVVGSSDDDSLIVTPELGAARVSLVIPAQVLPWRDLKFIEKNQGRRAAYGCKETDPIARIEAKVEGEQRIRMLTDIAGAESLELRDGVATILMGEARQLLVPSVRLADGVRMAARIRVTGEKKTARNRKFVHIAQYSGGQLIGGVSLELRKGVKRRKR